MQTCIEMTKNVKAQVEHAQKEIKANTPWIELVKKQQRNSWEKHVPPDGKESTSTSQIRIRIGVQICIQKGTHVNKLFVRHLLG